jgi:hydrogenase maturation protein HypF
LNNKTKKSTGNSNNFPKTYRISISGIVQGVGFRPFIYRLSKKNNLSGTVTNTTEGVSVKLNVSSKEELNNFISQIKSLKPPPALIEKIKYEKIPSQDFSDFVITKSTETAEKFQLVSPDIATCSNCIEDINNNHNKRRYYYPFTNCTIAAQDLQ